MAGQQVREADATARTKASYVRHPFCKNGKWGYIDARGTVIVEPQYDAAYDFHDGLAAVGRAQPRESGYIRLDGKWAFKVPEGVSAVGRFSGGRARFYQNGVYGYLDTDGHIAIKPTFDFAEDFSEGRAAVFRGKWTSQPLDPAPEGKWGYIDRDGKPLIATDLEAAHAFSDGLALISRSGSVQEFINTEGRVVLHSRSLFAGAGLSGWIQGGIHNGLAPIRIDGQGEGFIDRSGKLVIPAKFEMAREFSDGLAAVNVGKRFGFVDQTGNVVIAPQYDDVGSFHEGYCRVKCRNEWFFVDRQGCGIRSRNIDLLGRVIAASPWNDTEDFRGGLARVHVGGRFVRTSDGPAYWEGGVWYYVNACGTVVADCHLDGEPADALGHENLPN